MTEVIIEHKVRDFDAWLPVFREHDRVRREFGCEGAIVHRAEGDPNEVVLQFRWSSPQRFQEFMERSDIRKAMARAGVVGEPRVTVLSEPIPWQR